ncbi:MAG: ATP-binding protein [Muribaculaceae bacterium]
MTFLYRKYSKKLEDFLANEPNKILLVNGARQIGKSFIIRHVGQQKFKNFIEINLKADKEGNQVFAGVKSTEDFYLQIGAKYGSRLGNFNDTLIYLDEIQSYPHLMTLLKFLNQDKQYRYIASGSELGVALSQTPSVPLGSVAIDEMYPLDFEEFLLASGCSQNVIDEIKTAYDEKREISESLHNLMLRQSKLYLLVGGMPDAVKTFIETRNIGIVRDIQESIYKLYKIDASQYDNENKLEIRKVYDLIPSNMENKKKRVVISKINDGKRNKTFNEYADEFEYLTNSGVALGVNAISNPKFPLLESEHKNLIKLYLNDVGLLTYILYGNNINAVLNNVESINLGSVYESVVAQELHSHGFSLKYYDNKQKGEVDFIIDDYKNLRALPIEVKSGKDYMTHSALNTFLSTPDYNISSAIVLNNSRKITRKGGITYMPIYYVLAIEMYKGEDLIIPL